MLLTLTWIWPGPELDNTWDPVVRPCYWPGYDLDLRLTIPETLLSDNITRDDIGVWPGHDLDLSLTIPGTLLSDHVTRDDMGVGRLAVGVVRDMGYPLYCDSLIRLLLGNVADTWIHHTTVYSCTPVLYSCTRGLYSLYQTNMTRVGGLVYTPTTTSPVLILEYIQH